MHDFLTTRELAELLRIKERKVYDLASSGAVPCVKATGKLLFPRKAILEWLDRNCAETREPAASPVIAKSLPNIVLGSHDPLLDWALRQSGCGLATYFDGSVDGLERFARGEGLATGLHLQDPSSGVWNRATVAERFAKSPVVLVEWARRRRGLILSAALNGKVRGFADLAGKRLTPRQPASGAQMLLLRFLRGSGLTPHDVKMTEPARTEEDAALAIVDGRADAAFGLESEAARYRLAFLPVIEERYDLLVDRHAWFEPPMQKFLAFCHSPAFAGHVAAMAGYDVSALGAVHFNGAA